MQSKKYKITTIFAKDHPKKAIHKNPSRTLPTSTQIFIIQRTTIRIRKFSIHEEQRPTTSLCHEQKDDRREWNEFILRRPSTSCRTRDGNKMWNCKLCVGRIGPWTVVAVDHASRGPGLKGREPSPIARVDPSLNQERKREREKIKRERVVEDLNARSSDRTTFEPGVWASKELEICYVMSDDHSPVNMKKDFFGSNCRGEGEWFGGRSSLDKEVLRGLVARFWLEEEARSWTIVGMGHGARNIKRGIKETAVTYATRKSSSEKLHPSPHAEPASATRPLLHFNDAAGISRTYFRAREIGKFTTLSFLFYFIVE